MAIARLIVCERTGSWAAALRRVLPGGELPLRETRSLDECAAELAAAPSSVVVLEVSPGNLEAVSRLLAEWNVSFPLARGLVVTAGSLSADDAQLLREAGAVDVVCSPRRLAPWSGVVRRHSSRLPAEAMDPVEQVWASLPWAAYASGSVRDETG